MTFDHIHDCAEWIVFRDLIARIVEAAGRRHLAELRRAWQTPQYLNRSAGQKRRWANVKGMQQ